MPRMLDRTSFRPTTTRTLGASLLVAAIAACGGGAATTPVTTPTQGPPAVTAPPAASVTETPGPTSLSTSSATGPAALDGPASVGAGTVFQVAWTGPNVHGDYVTIVRKGTSAWTNESYFDTSSGSPGTLQAPLEAGDYELWYVGADGGPVQARAAITVTPYAASVTGPSDAAAGSTFQVQWTGPNGPGDYVTIVPVGAAEGAYLSYCDTSAGPSCTLTAPADAGSYELRYATAAGKPLATAPIAIH